MRLSQIYNYPLKSCRANNLQIAQVQAMGLAGDRRWMLSDGEGLALTARQYPKLVLIEVTCQEDAVKFTAPGMPELVVQESQMSEVEEVSLWWHRFPAQAGAWDADFWFSEYLGRVCRLHYIGQDTLRRTDKDSSVPLGFADGYPVLLIGSASLQDLNTRMPEPVSILQFRPNLVIETSEPYIEDHWQFIQIGEVSFENIKPCERCIFTTLNPATGMFHSDQQPLRTLNQYRQDERGTLFGVNLLPRVFGMIRMGDQVVVS